MNQEPASSDERSGPLFGLRVVELAGIGPAPHACTILADLGADVIRIERPGGQDLAGGPSDLLTRGRPSVALDLKHPRGAATVLELVRGADVLIEGMRPGVAERLGVGPDDCFGVNPKLVYGRMTGWGQDGPLAKTAGHDLTYIATAGVLHGLGQDADRPQFPVNLLGDFGGGSTYLVIGVLAAVVESWRSGLGQVVDAAIVDGAAHLTTLLVGLRAADTTWERRGENLTDGGAPFYGIYDTADDKHVAVAALEPKFFAELVDGLGLAGECFDQDDAAGYPQMRESFARVFRLRTQREWSHHFELTDACVAPVLTPTEAATHAHLRHRQTYAESAGVVQPAPAPRFSRSRPEFGRPPAPTPGADTRTALIAWGIDDVDGLIASGAALQD